MVACPARSARAMKTVPTGFSGVPLVHCDIGGCRSFSELPGAARNYIRFLEQAVGCSIRYVSVGAEREAYFEMS